MGLGCCLYSVKRMAVCKAPARTYDCHWVYRCVYVHFPPALMDASPFGMNLSCRPKVPPKSPVVFDVQVRANHNLALLYWSASNL